VHSYLIRKSISVNLWFCELILQLLGNLNTLNVVFDVLSFLSLVEQHFYLRMVNLYETKNDCPSLFLVLIETIFQRAQ